MKFSQRNGYDPDSPSGPIVEDAPEWLRREYIVRILAKLLYVDSDHRYSNQSALPLGIKSLNERLCIDTRREMEDSDWDSWSCEEGLTYTLVSCTWYQFYDCVETVGEILREKEAEYDGRPLLPTSGVHSYENYKFSAYRGAVNELFRKHNVDWQLNPRGELESAVPKFLADQINDTDARLEDKFETARVHYRKARSYVLGTTKDPENSIKESISAVESALRAIYPEAATLGKALERMRSAGASPAKLITVYQRFYDYTNAEPGVRHGSNVKPEVQMLDAELALHIATAFIRYSIEIHRREEQPDSAD